MSIFSLIDNTQYDISEGWVDGSYISDIPPPPPPPFSRDILILSNSSIATETTSGTITATTLFNNCLVSSTGTSTFAAGTFTVGTTGIYFFQITIATSSTTSYKGIHLFKNGSFLAGSRTENATAQTGLHMISQIIQLTAGDQLILKLISGAVSVTFTLRQDYKCQLIRLY